MRAVAFVLQTHLYPSGERIVHAAIDHRTAEAELALKLGDRRAGGVAQQYLGSFDLALDPGP